MAAPKGGGTSEGSPYDVVLHPYVTEKTMAQMERKAVRKDGKTRVENKLEFVVRRESTKQAIKAAIERLFETKVVHVNTKIGPDGQKRAMVRFADDVRAEDIATRVGIF